MCGGSRDRHTYLAMAPPALIRLAEIGGSEAIGHGFDPVMMAKNTIAKMMAISGALRRRDGRVTMVGRRSKEEVFMAFSLALAALSCFVLIPTLI